MKRYEIIYIDGNIIKPKIKDRSAMDNGTDCPNCRIAYKWAGCRELKIAAMASKTPPFMATTTP